MLIVVELPQFLWQNRDGEHVIAYSHPSRHANNVVEGKCLPSSAAYNNDEQHDGQHAKEDMYFHSLQYRRRWSGCPAKKIQTLQNARL
jgi:hypothetical protein